MTDLALSAPAASPAAAHARTAPRRRIGYVVSIFPELTETFIAREIEALKARGFDVQVFAIKRPRALPAGETLSSAATLRGCAYARPDRLARHLAANLAAMVRHPVRYASALRVFLRAWPEVEPGVFARLLYHFACGIGFAAEMRRRGIEHLHCHFTTGCNVALAAHLFSGIPFSFTAHASDDLFVKPVLLPTKVRHARAVVAVCDYSRRYLESVTGYADSRKLHRVYNGVDVDEGARLAAEREVGSAPRERRAPRLLSVGSLAGDAKGFVTLVEVCRLLRQSGYPVACRIIGGGPAEAREVLARRIAEAELAAAVELSGPRSIADVYRAMRDADVFVLLSEVGLNGFRDGFPTVLLEAMAMQLPVVSTWISGIPEIVADQVTGLLVPERNPRAAAAAIRRLLDDAALRSRLGAAGHERVRRRFGLARSADQLAGILSRAIDG